MRILTQPVILNHETWVNGKLQVLAPLLAILKAPQAWSLCFRRLLPAHAQKSHGCGSKQLRKMSRWQMDGKHSCSLEGNDSCCQCRATCHMLAAAACRQLSKTTAAWLLSNWFQLQVTQEVSQAVHVFSHPPFRDAWKRRIGFRLSLYACRRDVCSVQASCQVLAALGSNQVSKTTVA